MRLFHGGVPGLRRGDIIEPGHDRREHPGCPYCEARSAEKAGGDAPVIDPLAGHPDRVYATTHRGYARHYASLWGRGDLYYVEPVGDLQRSDEDTFETYHAPALRVVAVAERAVLLTWSQRRRLSRDWRAADLAFDARRQEVSQ